jgi:hypothetical protein
MIIYSITTINFQAEFHPGKGWRIDWKNYRDARVGFYSTLEQAQNCIANDWGNLNECGYYDYLVIQEEHAGLYNIAGLCLDTQTEWWYSRDYSKNEWVPSEKPEALKSMVNF